MNYHTPPTKGSSPPPTRSSIDNSNDSRSASPCRKVRASSLTPDEDSQDAQSASVSTSPLPLRKRPPRPTQLNEIFRPRCNTDPSRQSSSTVKKPPAPRSVLGSLIRQTLKVTTISVGFSNSDEGLTQLATSGSLSDNAKRRHSRSTSSVVCTVASGRNSGTDERATTSMAPLQLSAAAAAATTLSEQQQLQQQQRRQQFGQQTSLPETLAPDHSSLPQSYANSLQPSGSAHSLGHSPRNSHSQSRGNPSGNGSTAAKGINTAKQHEQQASTVAAISTASAAVGAGAGAATTTTLLAAASAVTVAPPPEKDKDKEKDKEKEKKRKEVSSSRIKKFHRHFSQISKDEKLINYFSCALVGDIPLQGHLYITEQHFAFYSNVFGYVTKVVIPTSSVTKISKEKTAKIIPNAVGVATAEERHVFGSFISRESAFRLMCTVCPQLGNGTEILPKPLPLLADVELTEEYLIDDDSSCSISGNESPPQLQDAEAAATAGAATEAADAERKQTIIRQRGINNRHSDLQSWSALDVDGLAHGLVTIRSSAPPVVHYEDPKPATDGELILNGNLSRNSSTSTSANASAASSGPPSSSSSPITVVGVGVAISAAPAAAANVPAAVNGPAGAAVAPARSFGGRLSALAQSARSHLSPRLPTLTEVHVLYLGIMLAIMLALFSAFLLYRILDIEAKTNRYNSPIDFNLRAGTDEDIFAEALRWQKDLQEKSTAEAQHILSQNLEQISKVRRSLETLSMLIHDRRAGYEVEPAAASLDAGVDASSIIEASSTHSNRDVSD